MRRQCIITGTTHALHRGSSSPCNWLCPCVTQSFAQREAVQIFPPPKSTTTYCAALRFGFFTPSEREKQPFCGEQPLCARSQISRLSRWPAYFIIRNVRLVAMTARHAQKKTRGTRRDDARKPLARGSMGSPCLPKRTVGALREWKIATATLDARLCTRSAAYHIVFAIPECFFRVVAASLSLYTLGFSARTHGSLQR